MGESNPRKESVKAMKVLSLILLLVSLYVAPANSQTASGNAQTKGSCSPATSGNNNTYVIKCSVDSAQGAKTLQLMNEILQKQIDPDALMAKLDEIKAAAAKPRVAQTCLQNNGEVTGNGSISTECHIENIPSGTEPGVVLMAVDGYMRGKIDHNYMEIVNDHRTEFEKFLNEVETESGNPDQIKASVAKMKGQFDMNMLALVTASEVGVCAKPGWMEGCVRAIYGVFTNVLANTANEQAIVENLRAHPPTACREKGTPE